MEIAAWYREHFEARLRGRYIALQHIEPLLDGYRDLYEISVIGTSEQGKEIHCVKMGNGKKVVLGWSQMHGNESTTTKALFDFFKFIAQKDTFQEKIKAFLAEYTFYSIPILNPDGAQLYTRENANQLDLNRDAKIRSQSESKALFDLFTRIEPQLCLNLHDQRTLYSLPKNQCATVSFLAPAANEQRTVTAARKIAMEEIAGMFEVLSELIPGQIGRYDDTFNKNCVGDRFQMADVPTILFEAGHFPGDYRREKTRSYIFYAFATLFGFIAPEKRPSYKDYFKISENGKQFRDVILRNVILKEHDKPVSLSITYEEVLEKGQIKLVPILDEIGDLSELNGHEEVDVKNSEILLNSYENVFVGEKVATIIDKYSNNCIFYKDSCNII